MSGKIIAYGALMERSIDGGTNFAAVPNCKGIAVPQVETDYQDVTDFDSPNGFKEYLPGLKDAGVISMPSSYTADAYAFHKADNALGVPVLYRLTLKAQTGQVSGDVITYSGYPTPKILETETEGNIDMEVMIRTTGDVTWTAGATS